MFTPNLSILPEPQKRLWRELKNTPKSFVLYGGTALALRLGHRQSEDFDFFSNISFRAEALLKSIPYLKDAEMSQFQDNTLTAIINRDGPVKVSFFGSLDMRRVHDPELAEEGGIQIASMLDLLASKLKTVQVRAEAKDYRDVAAMLETGLGLAEGLAAAIAVYGNAFNGALSLKALTFFQDGDLPGLPLDMQGMLQKAAASVDLKKLPFLASRNGLGREG